MLVFAAGILAIAFSASITAVEIGLSCGENCRRVTALGGLIDSAPNVMLVGHLPFMSRLAAWLITGSIEPPVFAFQNGGIVCLKENPDAGGWVIAWSLSPNIG